MKIKRLLSVAAIAVVGFSSCVVCGAAATAFKGFDIPAEALAQKGGHVQGIAVSADAVYVAQMTRITKFDFAGKVLAQKDVVSHTGDLCFRDGVLYSAVAVYGGPEKGKGKVQLFDADLNFLREATFPRGLDGIAFFNGALYVGQGAHLETVPHKAGVAPESRTSHRENELLVLDPKTLGLRSHCVYSHGNKTKYGAQNMTTDGKLLYVTFYSGESGAPDLVAYDAGLNPVARYRAQASNGFEFVTDPDGKAFFVTCVTRGGKGKPLTAAIRRIEIENGAPKVPRVSDVVSRDGGASAMRTEANSSVVKTVEMEAPFVVCGGGLSGICAAIAAARHGAKVVLVQDRPMLGGNASSEMRMGIMGAAGDDNKEAGILEELQLMNFYANPLRRYTLWDDVLYSAVIREKNITLLLNTSVDGVEMAGGRIAAVKAWNGNAYTRYVIRGKLFADCTGDGILRLSGAKYRHGREKPEEFGEDFQQGGGDGRTMGNSILLQLRKTEEDHPFVAPAWAYRFTDADFVPGEKAPKGKSYSLKRPYPGNNNFWWIEFGGNFDTIADANEIQLELKKIAYGVWAYIKNHPDGRGKGYDLDWIGAIPGKRESVRFVGPRILTQHDVMSGGHFEDVVAYGGWTLDDHNPNAFWNPGHLSEHHRPPSPFGIPFDCLYSVNVPNLMFAGRDISVTHMALSATRVMATCAIIGQAVGTAASIAIREKCDPAEVRASHLAELQATLEDDDCRLPFRWRKVSSLTAAATTAPANEPLRNGIDRGFKKADNGVWLAPGEESAVYEWKTPQRVSGARLVFDSVMKGTTKRMMKLEAEHGRVKMPAPLAKAFRLDARIGGVWKTVAAEKLNIRRLSRVAFEPVEADALRLVVTEAWGGGKAHVFAFDALSDFDR